MSEQSEEVKRRIAKRRELQADPVLVQQRLSRALAEASARHHSAQWGREGQPERMEPLEARLEQIEKRLETLELKR